MPPAREDHNLLYRAGVLLIVLVLGLLMYEFARWIWYSPAELSAYDMLLHLRSAPHARKDIAILAIDSRTTDAVGRLPWSGAEHARIVNALNRAGAKLIVYDMPVSGSDSALPRGEALLRSALRAKGNVILTMPYDPLRRQEWSAPDMKALFALEKFVIPGRIVYTRKTPMYRYYYFEPPTADLVIAARGIGVPVAGAGGGVVREANLAYLTGIRYPVPSEPLPAGITLPSLNGSTGVIQGLPLVVSRAVFDVGQESVNVDFTRSLTFLANLTPGVDIPMDEYGGMMVNYAGPSGSYPRYSAIDLLQRKLAPRVFSGKTVFVGITDAAFPSRAVLPTPYGLMPQVEADANAVGTILDRSYIVRSTFEALLVLLVLSIILGLLYPAVDLLRLGPLAFGLSLTYIIIAMLVLAIFRHAWPVIPAVTQIILSAVAAGLLKPSMFSSVRISREAAEAETPAA